MKVNLKTILAVVTIISMSFGALQTCQSMKHKADAKRQKTNLYTKTIEYEDQLGRSVTETMELNVTVKEMKKAAKKDSSQLSNYERKILEFKRELDLSDRQLKSTEAVMKLDVTTRNTFETVMESIEIENIPIKKAYVSNKFGSYDITYNPANDSIKMEMVQINEFYIDMYKEREPNKKGNKVFILWRWIKDWQYKGSVKTLNDSTIINEFTLLKINKR